MKRIASIILSLIIALPAIVPAFASQECSCGKTPLVVVSGMGSLPLVADKGLPTERVVWPLKIDKNKLITASVLGLGAAAVTGDINKFADAVIPVIKKTVEPAACNADGDSKYNVSVALFPKSMAFYPDFVSASSSSERGLLHAACDALGADHTYFFKYDWRLDPLVNAEALNTLIQTALAETRHKKVDLAVASSGGNQALAYFEKYGGEAVENCVFISSVFSGSLLAGNLFTKRIQIDKNTLKVYAKANLDSSDFSDELGKIMLDLFDVIGGLGKSVDFTNKCIKTLIPRVYDEILAENFCTYPGLWALIRDEDYETAKAGLLDKTKNKKLIDRIDDFHYNVRQNRKEIIENIMKQGVKVSFCSNYNSYAAPFYPSANQQTDDTVEAFCTSAEAYFAPLGSTLPKGYTQQKYLDGKNYISPDNIIDASASMFPDKVWFFKDLGHVGCSYGSEHCAFVLWLLWQENPTVWADAGHPQFMGTNDSGKTLYSLKAVNDTATTKRKMADSQRSVKQSMQTIVQSWRNNLQRRFLLTN